MIRLAALILLLPSAGLADGLPLIPGFYVDSTVRCAEASNATLALLKQDGLNSARTDCTFTGFAERDDGSYAYTESCTDIDYSADGSGGQPYDNEGNIQFLGPESFRLFGEGFSVTFLHCPQSDLPEPWRDNDISDIVN